VLIDTHCHLDAAEFASDRDAVVARAVEAGVASIVVPSVGRSNFIDVAALCRNHVLCFPAYGIHPMYVDQAHESDLDILRDWLIRERPVAVGEIGLDRFVEQRDDERQESFFIEQLKLAQEMKLPVILHVRSAIDIVLKHLRRVRVCGGIAHAFNGSRQQAEEFIKLGFKLGFGGALTWSRATRIRKLAATLPLDSIVIETDAPDIPPMWLEHGGRNEPFELRRIAEELAGLRQMSLSQLSQATSRNAEQVLGLLGR
jgi:TatD DNase family protein